MRQFARQRFGTSRALHSENAEPHGRHARRRAGLITLALGVACLGLSTTVPSRRRRPRRRPCRRPSSSPATPTRAHLLRHPAGSARVSQGHDRFLPTPISPTATRRLTVTFELTPGPVSAANVGLGRRSTFAPTCRAARRSPRPAPEAVTECRNPTYNMGHLDHLRQSLTSPSAVSSTQRPKRVTVSRNYVSTQRSPTCRLSTNRCRPMAPSP